MTDDNKLPLTSSDITAELLAQLREIAPQVFTEGGVDFDKLKATLGENIVPKEERYGLSWAGKSEAFRNVQIPSVGTLLPQPEESVNFDTSENLIIEGDNLEVLKLFQKSYHGKVKMIYIDPPYNTGNDFIYPDNYREGLDDYLKYSGQVSEEGVKQSTNTETSGRFHSKWLNMMYPRLFLARNLLRDDGVIFVSIDDNEMHNLRLLMNELFGEENFVEQIVVVKSENGMGGKEGFATNHEYVVCYKRSLRKDDFYGLTPSSEYIAKFDKKDSRGRYKIDGIFRKKGDGARREDSPGCFYPVYYDGASGDVSLQPKAGYSEVYPKLPDGGDGRWVWSPDFAKGKEYRLFSGPNGTIYIKDYLEDGQREKPKSVFRGAGYLTDRATAEIKGLFGEKAFPTVKPLKLLVDLIDCATLDGDLILDFFAGSGTTAQALLELNTSANTNRRFILVQLPEKLDGNEYSTIADITRERVRRSINKLNEESPKTDLDRGFKSFKLSSSNFKIWDADSIGTEPEAIAEQLRLYADNVERERNQRDILYELMLKSGFPLSAKVEQIEVADKPVYSIAQGQLLICLENKIDQAVLRGMVALSPIQMLCLDRAFGGNDQMKTNTVLEAKSQGVMFRTV